MKPNGERVIKYAINRARKNECCEGLFSTAVALSRELAELIVKDVKIVMAAKRIIIVTGSSFFLHC